MISERITHPHYKSKYAYNDIGLIKLDRKVPLDHLFHASCLPEVREFQGYQTFNTIGLNKNKEIIVQETFLTNQEKCSHVYKANKNGLFKFEIHEDIQICATVVSLDEECVLGKIGAPIITNYPKFHIGQIVGINTVETSCASTNTSAIFTRIYPFTKWIEKYIFPDFIKLL